MPVTQPESSNIRLYLSPRAGGVVPSSDKVDALDDKDFVGEIPDVYERLLVPLIFEAYATDIARRVAERRVDSVLELAAGTGVATRALAAALPPSPTIVATDLNQPMLDKAASIGTARPVTWRQADALTLPFDDGTFHAVVCQFGVMFFPDRARAYGEAHRVLKDGGVFVFNVWDRIEDNEIADVVTMAVAALFPDDPPNFLPRTPHGHHDASEIESDLRAGGFDRPVEMTTVTQRSRARTAYDAAAAYVLGTPLLNEIQARDPSRVDEAVRVATQAVLEQLGEPVDAKIQAIVVAVEKARA